MRPFLFFLILLSLSFEMKAQEQQVVVPYALAERDRAIRTEARMEALETKMEALETKMDVKFESQQRQLDQINTMLFWGFGVLTSLILFILGYMIWDRRTAL